MSFLSTIKTTSNAICNNYKHFTINIADATCGFISLPNNVAFQRTCLSPAHEGTKCEIKCIDGYEKITGDTLRTCQSNGLWSGAPLQCSRKLKH